MKEFIVPDTHPNDPPVKFLDVERSIQMFILRRELQHEGMYAHVNWKWVNPFVEWINGRRVLEIMSGPGHLAKALREKGVNVTATDSHSYIIATHNPNATGIIKGDKWQFVTHVERLGANRAIAKYGKWCDVLLVSWPYMNDAAYYALKAINRVNPNALVVYIGEWRGWTGSDNFHNHFQEIPDPSFRAVYSNYMQWNEVKDKPYLGRYFENQENIPI